MYISDSKIRKVVPNRNNYNWGKQHVVDDIIFEYEEQVVASKQFLVNALVVVGHYENAVQVGINLNGDVLSHTCDCIFHSSNSACGHVAAVLFHFNYEHQGDYHPDITSNHLERERIWQEQQRIRQEAYEKRMQKLREEESLYFLSSFKQDATLPIEIHEEVKDYQIQLFLEEKHDYYFRDRLSISAKVGDKKMYVIKNIKNFIDHIENNEYASYGKNFGFLHKTDAFDEASKQNLELLKKLVYRQIAETNKRNVILDKNTLDECYALGMNQDKRYIGFKCEKRVMEVVLRVQKKGNSFRISVESHPDVLEGRKGFYTFEGNTLFRYDIDNVSQLSKLLQELKFNDLYLNENMYIEFVGYLHSLFGESVRLEGDTIDLQLQPNEKELHIYADVNDEDNLIVELKALHDEELNVMQKDFAKQLSINALRVKQTLINTMDFNEETSYFYEQVGTEAFQEIVDGVLPSLQDYAEVFVSESLRNMREHYELPIQIGVRVESNLLKVDISSFGLDAEEISKILSAYKRKKKFYKLKNGDIISTESSSIEELNNFLSDMNIDASEIGNEISLPLYDAYRMEDKMKDLQNVSGKENDSFQAVINNLKNVDINEHAINDEYEEILKPYQKDGVKWLMHLEQYKFGGILADDMGLGKTLQVIALLESIYEKGRTSIVVCPASLMLNWQDELNKFNSKLHSICVYGTRSSRKQIINDYESYDLLITTYDYMKRDHDLYIGKEFHYIILDEAQYIKNHTTKASKSVKSLEGENRLALTGTPIENSLAELWSIFDFLMPNYLFNYHYFKQNYETPIIKGKDVKKQISLKQMVEPFLLRRKKSDVLKELPNKEERVLRFQFSEKEEKLYLAKLSLVNKELRELLHSGEKNNIAVLKMLTQLRQICCEPRVLFENVNEVSSKMQGCIEVVESFKESDKKVLVFSSFTKILDLLANELEHRGFSYQILQGSVGKKERKEMVDTFQEGKIDVFLISLKAGSVGLNLTKAQGVIHYDPWWNVSAQNQATDRAYRIGQENDVEVYNLIMKDSIEERILDMQKTKKDISDMFVENSSGNIAALSTKDIMELLKRE